MDVHYESTKFQKLISNNTDNKTYIHKGVNDMHLSNDKMRFDIQNSYNKILKIECTSSKNRASKIPESTLK